MTSDEQQSNTSSSSPMSPAWPRPVGLAVAAVFVVFVLALGILAAYGGPQDPGSSTATLEVSIYCKSSHVHFVLYLNDDWMMSDMSLDTGAIDYGSSVDGSYLHGWPSKESTVFHVSVKTIPGEIWHRANATASDGGTVKVIFYV